MNVNALLAAAIHEDNDTDFSCLHLATIVQCEWRAAHLIATPSGTALVNRIEALETARTALDLAPDEWRAVMTAVRSANECHRQACGHVDESCGAGDLDWLVKRVEQAMKLPLLDEYITSDPSIRMDIIEATPEARAALEGVER